MHRLALVATVLVLAAGCADVRRATPADRLSPDEKLDYLVLSALDPAAGQTYALEPGPGPRRAYRDWFWRSAPGADTLDRAAFEARAAEARTFFGGVDVLNDDRVKTYIRWGPARRESYQPEPVRTETLTIIVNPAEIWTYPALGRQYDFVKTGTAYRLIGQTRFGPGTFFPMLEETDAVPRIAEPPRSAARVGFEFTVARFESCSDTVATEVFFGIPVTDLARLEERGVPAVVRLDFEWQGRQPANSTRRRVHVTGVVEDSTVSELAVGRQAFRLRADDYRLRVTVSLPDGSSFEQERRVNLLDYVRREQPVSDLAFYALADSSFQSPQFSAHDWTRLVPAVRTSFPSGGTFYVLYELYNLANDSSGDHRVEATYQLINEDDRKLALVPTPPRFAAGPGATATIVERVHLMDLRAGPYLLVCRIRDLVSGRELSLTARFRIQPRT
ncbi:hypothetical protein JXB37_02700 [candidate division WOR-3 bacterium]|nr:hypothetical protein [candidate division WOR-3 bacterium]